jgi:hypothetical protein
MLIMMSVKRRIKATLDTLREGRVVARMTFDREYKNEAKIN